MPQHINATFMILINLLFKIKKYMRKSIHPKRNKKIKGVLNCIVRCRIGLIFQQLPERRDNGAVFVDQTCQF